MALSTLAISGSTINRPANRIILDKWKLPLDTPGELEFTELGVDMPGSYGPENAVTLSIAGLGTVFNGWIFSRGMAGYTRGMPSVGYRALDQKFAAYLFPVTASDGTGTMAFNLPSTNPTYQSTESGLSVGAILGQAFAQHSTQLGNIGVSTDATTASQLATLTVVPPDPVYFQGNRFWSQVDAVMQLWYGSKYCVVITGAGLIRVVDTTALTAHTLTFGTDPILLDSLNEDTTESFTQVIIRGRDNVDGAYVSLGEGTLIDPHNAVGDNLEATWTIADFLTPKGASSTGTASTVTSVTITVQSDDPTEHWIANYWSGIQAQISAIDPLSTLVTGYETHRVTANTALTAGGTSIITIDIPFSSTGFTRYALRGQPTGISECYRQLNFLNTYVAQHLVAQFNFAMNFSPSQGAVTQVWFPIGVVQGVSGGVPFQFQSQFEVVPFNGTTNGYIRFYEPWVMEFNSQAALIAGGGAVNQATDIKMLIPFSRGTMTAVAPSSGFAGTAFSRFNVQRPLVREYLNWWDQGSTTAMTTLAGQILDTVSSVTQEGQVTYLGQYLTALVPGAPVALNLASATGTTTYEAMAAPVRTATLVWPQSGGAEWQTILQFTTKRQMYSGDRLYVHTNFGSAGILSSAGFSGVGVSGMPDGSATFSNSDFSSGNEFSPVFNAQEIQAGNLAAGREAGGTFGIQAGEADDRPQQAAARVQASEDNALGRMT